MLKLFTDIDLLTEKNRGLVFPLLFDLHYGNNDYLSDYYTIVDDINDSDIAIFPLEYSYGLKYHKSLVNDFLTKAKTLNKTIWVYSGGDFGFTINDESIFNFRLSGFKSKLNSQTVIMPSFINDPYDAYLKLKFTTINKEKLPRLGFVGHAKGGIKKYVKELLSFVKVTIKRILLGENKDYQSFYPSSIKRAKYLKRLSESKNIITNFVLRNDYRAGVKNKEQKENTTREFYQNIYDNPYTFCIRGAGNFSVRFYETLAVGRIPVLIDTDCELPLSHKIKWGKHCVIIKEENHELMVAEIQDFHSRFSEGSFIEFQNSNRFLWKNLLRRDRFFKEIHDDFLLKNTNNSL